MGQNLKPMCTKSWPTLVYSHIFKAMLTNVTKTGLLKAMLQHTHVLSSATEAFNEECATLCSIFSWLYYPIGLKFHHWYVYSKYWINISMVELRCFFKTLRGALDTMEWGHVLLSTVNKRFTSFIFQLCGSDLFMSGTQLRSGKNLSGSITLEKRENKEPKGRKKTM